MEQKTENPQIRLTKEEKSGFEQSALLAGIPLSSWVRERLRLAAFHELESVRRRVPFIREIQLGDSNE